MIALQKPVRPATGGEPAGAPLFIFGNVVYAKDLLNLKMNLVDQKMSLNLRNVNRKRFNDYIFFLCPYGKLCYDIRKIPMIITEVPNDNKKDPQFQPFPNL